MTSGIRTTVAFSCPKCGRIYQATQEHVAEKRAGRRRLPGLRNGDPHLVRVFSLRRLEGHRIKPMTFGARRQY